MEQENRVLENKNITPIEELIPVLEYIVHDLRNPISAADTWIKRLKKRKSELLTSDKELEKFIGRIETDINRTKQELDDFESVLDRASNSIKTYPTSLHLSVASAFSGVNIPESIEIVNQVTEDIPAVLATKHLTWVFRNLIENAIEAMPNGGSLFISPILNSEEKEIHITFQDTGRGILAKFRPLLFLPSFSTKEQEGHGIGLAWSRAYLHFIDGEIDLVESQIGQGSKFKVTIPFIF